MGRVKEFDPDAALRTAMELFWRQGYEATSMQDLVDHLGLGRGSIYGAFGGKRDLFLAAVERYADDARTGLLDQLSAPGSSLEAVRALVRWYARTAVADEHRKGCLVTNTAVELPGDTDAARLVASELEAVETALTTALMRARSEGELPAERDPAALARFLVTVLQGIRVVGKTSLRQRLIDDTVEQALALLD
ncbi:TetR/AcrR family transcriptional regulator, transcriptional repressor for nem operon [Saccharopolyspora antimicrobica]|uniref:TetR family transcriptional regulator n=1 Tax=Saccharopolyspora antimicrobica TaxID=455193 RepID=A0A1I4R790_9PSEU|nr:TetR/AcrR family transcriptional regulator [Saccharopolyspora antimicrobica]RKT88133.1 TetR family transcriptional regulator [Saccharopolyspora antimicrobica]SFM48172.1 TetR/AcrR family transcriptional regulator, transcriptional repressor for nem operon [Saccharopolyspora antimicrobica]